MAAATGFGLLALFSLLTVLLGRDGEHPSSPARDDVLYLFTLGR